MKHNNIIGRQIRFFRRERGWSLGKFNVRLKLSGWDISFDELGKIETRARVVPDYELGYFTEAFGLDITALFPMQPLNETANHYVTRLMSGDS